MKKIYLKGSVIKSDNGFYEITASTSAIDRQGDSIDQAGWDLVNFKSNPVLLWAHDYGSLPIGKVTDINVVDGSLKAVFEFAPEDANPRAAQIQKLYEGGYINASSVGLIPKERNGHVITKAELLELSLVPVPANQEALRLAINNKSIDVSLIETDLEKGEVAEEEEFSITAGLLACIDGDTENNEEIAKALNLNTEDVAKFIDTVCEKAGKRLSKKTIKQIDLSIASMQESIKSLENLKKEDDQTDSSAGEAAEGENTKVDTIEEVVELSVSEFLQSIQSHVRTSDKANEQTNVLINAFLSKRKGK